jgi:hypothetical protein
MTSPATLSDEQYSQQFTTSHAVYCVSNTALAITGSLQTAGIWGSSSSAGIVNTSLALGLQAISEKIRPNNDSEPINNAAWAWKVLFVTAHTAVGLAGITKDLSTQGVGIATLAIVSTPLIVTAATTAFLYFIKGKDDNADANKKNQVRV